MIAVSAVIPARNEVVAIAAVVRGCRAHVDEVIVVDDASSDGTGAAARDAGASVIRSDVPLGKGAALRRGARAARGEVVVFLDGDGQDAPDDIPRLLAALADGADLVIGSRFLGQFERGAITPIDRAGNRALSWLFSRLFRVRLTDTQAGFRATRRALLQRLPLSARRYDIETELLARALQAGATVVEVPVRRCARTGGKTGLHRVADGLRILSRMIAVRGGGGPGTQPLS
ncbi:MAG: glycosyltransferase family 2 protein [Nannocystaceae bacterium]|nr:glycosyltransferase family 2 protein [Nannocystaceae bacterium]